MLSLKQVVSALSASSSGYLTLKELCEATGVTPTPENLHKVLKDCRTQMESANDYFDMGMQAVPMVVPWRGALATHGFQHERINMPDDPSVAKRKADSERKTVPQVNLMPAVRLVNKADWDRLSSDDTLRESLRTGVLKTLADLPESSRILFGDVKSVGKAPSEGWALVSLLVKVS